MRLVERGSEYEGWVEVFDRCLWGAVSGEDWSIKEANIVCRQLGYPSASDVWNEDLQDQKSMLVLFAVSCRGNEKSLEECNHRWLNDNYDDFNINELAFVSCNPTVAPQGKQTCSELGSDEPIPAIR